MQRVVIRETETTMSWQFLWGRHLSGIFFLSVRMDGGEENEEKGES
jgi:hypothetical protein